MDKIEQVIESLQPIRMEELHRIEHVGDDTQNVQLRIPIKPDGSDDTARPTRFFSQVPVTITGRVYPVNFEIKEPTLQAALENYRKYAAEAAVQVINSVVQQQVAQAIFDERTTETRRPS